MWFLAPSTNDLMDLVVAGYGLLTTTTKQFLLSIHEAAHAVTVPVVCTTHADTILQPGLLTIGLVTFVA